VFEFVEFTKYSCTNGNFGPSMEIPFFVMRVHKKSSLRNQGAFMVHFWRTGALIESMSPTYIYASLGFPCKIYAQAKRYQTLLYCFSRCSHWQVVVDKPVIKHENAAHSF
jgi:hypothetical protein